MHLEDGSRDYFPISVDTISPDRLPPMDLFLQRKEEDIPVLFLSRTFQLSKEDIKVLKENEYSTLWLLEEDYKTYDSYLDTNLIELVHDRTISIETKCELTYNVSAQIMERVFSSQDPKAVIEASTKILDPVIDVIFENETASHQFILRASVDYELYTHSINVCLYGMSLAHRALGISKQEAIKRFGPALLLHDIGKTTFPRELIHKHDNWTDDEYELYVQHPQLGLELVKEFMPVTKEMESIFLHHHERMDGSGFPFGLEGSEISIAARLCAIVDTFDNLSTSRPARDRQTSFDALNRMKNELHQKLDYDLFREFVFLFLSPDEPV